MPLRGITASVQPKGGRAQLYLGAGKNNPFGLGARRMHNYWKPMGSYVHSCKVDGRQMARQNENACGWEGWVRASSIIRKGRCTTCQGGGQKQPVRIAVILWFCIDVMRVSRIASQVWSNIERNDGLYYQQPGVIIFFVCIVSVSADLLLEVVIPSI